jgi:hypothetical protein
MMHGHAVACAMTQVGDDVTTRALHLMAIQRETCTIPIGPPSRVTTTKR